MAASGIRRHLALKYTRRVDIFKPMNPHFHPLGQPGPEYGGFIGFLNKVPHGFRAPIAFGVIITYMYWFRSTMGPQKNGGRSIWNVQLPIHDDRVVDSEWDWRYRTQFDVLNFGHVYKAIHNDRLRKAGLLDDQGNFIGELPDYVKPGAPVPAIPQHPDDQAWVNFVLRVDKGIAEGWLPADFHHFNMDDYFWQLEELKEKGDEDGAVKLLAPFLLMGFGNMDRDMSNYSEIVQENGTPGLELWFRPSNAQFKRVLEEYLNENCKK